MSATKNVNGLGRRLAMAALFVVTAAPARASVEGRADAQYFLGRFDEALRSYREAVLRSTGDAEGFLNLGVLYRDAGRALEAERAFASAAALKPADADSWDALGSAALQAGDLARALSASQTAVDLSGGYQARLGLGRALLEKGDAAAAAAQFKAAAAERRGHALADFYLGRALEAQGLADEAQDAYKEALRQDGQFSEIRLALGRLYKEKNKVDEAWVQYAKAAALDPKAGHAAAVEKALAPRLSKPPESLIPVVRIAAAKRVTPAPAGDDSPLLRVAIAVDENGRPQAQKALAFRCSGPFTLAHASGGAALVHGSGGALWTLRKVPHKALYEILTPGGERAGTFHTALRLSPLDARDTLVLGALPSGSGYAWSALKEREFRGSVEIRPQGSGGLVLVNRVHLEDYLYGVVGDEMPVDWPLEALKAQSVLARTEALAARTLSPHSDRGYDLCDGQHCQVYGGVASEAARVREAVDATRGLVLEHGGVLAKALYSADCGGHTQSSEDAGWGDDDSLRGVSDAEPPQKFPDTPWGFESWIRHEPPAYCGDARYSGPAEVRWDRVIAARDLSERVALRAAVGRVKAVRVLDRGRSGHVRRVEFVGEQGTWIAGKEMEIRRVLGLGALRSTFFFVEAYPAANGEVSEFVVHGAGWGHAVGLCQSGAAGRAGRGEDFRSILTDYYPTDQLKTLDAAPPAHKRPPFAKKTTKVPEEKS